MYFQNYQFLDVFFSKTDLPENICETAINKKTSSIKNLHSVGELE